FHVTGVQTCALPISKPANGQRLDPAAPCPPLEVDENIAVAVAQKQRADEAKVAELVSNGTKAIKLVYADGDQHESFRRRMAAVAIGRASGRGRGEVS